MKRAWVFALLLIPLMLTPPVSAQTGDTTPPTTSHVLNPETPDGENDWYKSPVNVALSADDSDSGVASINWKIGNDPWQEQTFPPTLNLLQNSSFESGSGLMIEKWEGSGTAGAVFLHDGTEAYDGSYSAKITNTTSGWSGWNNRTSYAVAEPWANMSASAWFKAEDIVGDAYFKVYARTPSAGDVCIANCSVPSEKVTGTTNWTRLFLNFTVTVSDAYGVYLDIGLNGTGTLWIDYATLKGTPTDTSVDLVISKNGEFDLEYYSVDHIGNEELPHHFVPLKIDTKAPGNWRDFAIEETLNDHTLISRITVSDTTSGLQIATATPSDRFQYSVDAGENWGYFEDLIQCYGSPWHSDEWLDLSTAGPPGVESAQLVTPEVDYCDSNWKICKTIRFRIKDMAGNESYKDICINGAWSQASGQGDVYAQDGISFAASGAADNTDGVVISGGDISGFTSTQGWIVSNYSPLLTKPSYAEWQENFPALTSIDRLPTENGAYLINSNFTIASTTIPGELATAAFGAVVFINGDLTINEEYSLGSAGALVFIVSGNVDIDKDIDNVAGVFLADGRFDSAYNGGHDHNTLNLYGSVLADSFILSRSLFKHDNTNNPAELFTYEPKYLELMRNLLSEEEQVLRWFEVGL